MQFTCGLARSARKTMTSVFHPNEWYVFSTLVPLFRIEIHSGLPRPLTFGDGTRVKSRRPGAAIVQQRRRSHLNSFTQYIAIVWFSIRLVGSKLKPVRMH